MNNVVFLCKGCDSERVYGKHRPKVGARRGRYPVLSAFIKMRRKHLSFTRKEMAKALNLAVEGVQPIEIGRNGVREEHLAPLAEFLGVEVSLLRSMSEVDQMLAAKKER